MKLKRLLLVLALILSAITVIAQTGSQNTPKNIELTFDPTTNTISPGPNLNYSKGRYVVVIKGVNDAFHSGKFSPEFLNKVSAIPSVLSNLIPTNTPTVAPASAQFALTWGGAGGTAEEIAFIDAIAKDYAYIESLGSNTKKSLHFLETNWSSATNCKADAQSKIGDINKVAAVYGILLNVNVRGGHSFVEPVRPIESVVNDFLTRVAIVHNDDDLMAAIPLDKKNQLFAAEDFVKANKDFINNCPDMLEAILNCRDEIKTKTYDLNSDYFRLSLNLMQNRFGSKPDTVASQKLTFYRSDYIKFDVTSGFFFNNLYNRSYYFKDTIGTIGTEHKSKSDLAVGALFHGYYVVTGSFKAGLAIGAAVSLLDGKTKYLGGPSLVFGRKKEFAISGGVSMANLDAPSGVLKNGQTFSLKNTTGSVPVASKVSWGYFFGLSYSIIKL